MKENRMKRKTETNEVFFVGCTSSNFKFRAGVQREKRVLKKDGHQTLGTFKELQIVLEGESVSCCALLLKQTRIKLLLCPRRGCVCSETDAANETFSFSCEVERTLVNTDFTCCVHLGSALQLKLTKQASLRNLPLSYLFNLGL